jgi:uncharacterized protein (DUF1330 family)
MPRTLLSAALISAIMTSTACAQTSTVTPAAAVPNPVAATALDPKVCDHKPVIMVVSGLIHDRQRLASYAKAIRESGLYPKLGGYYMNNPRPVATFEGTPPANQSILMVRFPCLAHARAFWYSELYQKKIIPERVNPSAGDFTVTVYAENALPDYMKGRVAPGDFIEKPDASVAASIPMVPTP